MYNLDYITTQTREEIIESLEYDINKFDKEDIKNIFNLYNEDLDILRVIATNYNTDFDILLILASMDNEDIFSSLLDNIYIVKYKSIISYIMEESKSGINQYLAYRIIIDMDKYL